MRNAESESFGLSARPLVNFMPGPSDDAEIAEHLQEVGRVCTHWAYLEFLLELALWWLLGLLNHPNEGRIITSGFAIDGLARRVRDLAHLKITDASERETLGVVASRINAIADDRNLAVHGVRSVQPDETVQAVVSRGKYKHQPEQLSPLRLRSITAEIACIIAELEPLLARHNVIEGTTAISERYSLPREE